jgi:hypothetical protein
MLTIDGRHEYSALYARRFCDENKRNARDEAGKSEEAEGRYGRIYLSSVLPCRQAPMKPTTKVMNPMPIASSDASGESATAAAMPAMITAAPRTCIQRYSRSGAESLVDTSGKVELSE